MGSKQTTFTLRTHTPCDIPWITARHGALYAEEHNWGQGFSTLVDQIAADFQAHHDPATERCWIAEDDDSSDEHESRNLGCIMLVRERDQPSSAKLRLLLVEPRARGRGVGKALVRACVDFAREAGYARIVLWTQRVLESARRLYAAEGFSLVREEEHEGFGEKVVGEEWVLAL
ncbi:acyl-CoA N-acyltransferase [Aspergillus taichungensis]|uniref:Acyl-CoA N-acyltransferase n=1 Tax=Aspergillus taichungensis TaxID=482145 RepID=A0A2J5HQJ8_9EURO|nr:acyl-CoA N-acyltransferase [Aspergillus taichungensis]